MTEARQQATAVSVMLIVADADAAVAWYKDALGATELWNLGGVAGLEVGGAPFFLHEVNPGNPAERSPDADRCDEHTDRVVRRRPEGCPRTCNRGRRVTRL